MQTNQSQAAPKKRNVAAKVAKREQSGLNAAEFKQRVVNSLVRMNKDHESKPNYTFMDQDALLEKVRRAPRSAKLFFTTGQDVDGKKPQMVVYLKTEDREVYYGASYGSWSGVTHVTADNIVELDQFFFGALQNFYANSLLVDKLDTHANAPVKTQPTIGVASVKQQLKDKAKEAFGTTSSKDELTARHNFKKELQRSIMQVSSSMSNFPYYQPVDVGLLKANLKSIMVSGELYFHPKPSYEPGVPMQHSDALLLQMSVATDTRVIRLVVKNVKGKALMNESFTVKKLNLDLIPQLNKAFKMIYSERAQLEPLQDPQDWNRARGTAKNVGTTTAVGQDVFQSAAPSWTGYPTPLQQGFRATPPQNGLFGGTSLMPSGMPSQSWNAVAMQVVGREMQKAQEALRNAQMEVNRIAQLGHVVQSGGLNFQGQINHGEEVGQFSVLLNVVLSDSPQDLQMRKLVGDTFSVTNTYSGAFPTPSPEGSRWGSTAVSAAAIHLRQRMNEMGFGSFGSPTADSKAKLHRVIQYFLAAQGKIDPQMREEGAEILDAFSLNHPTQAQYDTCMNVLNFYSQRISQINLG